MAKELSTLSIRELRKRRQKVAQTLEKLKQAKYYASLQTHPDVSYPIMSCKSFDGLNRQHETAYRKLPRRDHNNQIININLYEDENNLNNPSVADETEIMNYYQNWRKIRVLELEILRLIRDNVVEAMLYTIMLEMIEEDEISNFVDEGAMEIPQMMRTANRRLERKIEEITGKTGPVDSHDFDTYLKLLENIFVLEPVFLTSPYLEPYSQHYQTWNFALLRQVLVDRQFEGVEIPEQYVLGVVSNSNFTERLFLNYYNFFHQPLRAGGSSYMDSLLKMNEGMPGNDNYQRRFKEVAEMLMDGSWYKIDFLCRRDFPGRPELDQTLLFHHRPDVNAFNDPDDRLFRNSRAEDEFNHN